MLSVQGLGGTERGGPITEAIARRMMARPGEEARIGLPVHLHMLRHATASTSPATAWIRAAALTLSARAQKASMPVIAFLGSASPDLSDERLRAFRRALKNAGYIEGQNVQVESIDQRHRMSG